LLAALSANPAAARKGPVARGNSLTYVCLLTPRK
jgi:hypothetical protein